MNQNLLFACAVGATVWSVASYYLAKKPIKSSKTTVRYVEAPTDIDVPSPSLFLGGGISGCPDWQQEIRQMLNTSCPNLVLVNPRREKFNLNDKTATPVQIRWEFDKLRQCTAIMFYFPKETLCPITLLELGSWLIKSKETRTKVFVQCHPEYARLLDVQVQTQLVTGTIEVIVSDKFDKLVDKIHEWYSTQQK